MNRPHERETFRTTRDQDRKPRPRERSAERQPSQSRNRAPAPRGKMGNTRDTACFRCSKTGVRSGHPGCASPRESNEKGNAALAAYKRRVDGLPRARPQHVMAAVAPTREAPRMSLARAAILRQTRIAKELSLFPWLPSRVMQTPLWKRKTLTAMIMKFPPWPPMRVCGSPRRGKYSSTVPSASSH